MSVYEITLLLNDEKEREERIREAFDKVAEINGAALKRLADSDKGDIVEHNGKQYRKVKRKASVGELVVVTNKIEICTGYKNGDVYEVDKDFAGARGNGASVNGKFSDGSKLYLFFEEYHVLEPLESTPTLTERDLITNLAQEVASLKKDLHHAQSDIADLEDRVDENEKDTEEVIGRINDVSDAVIPIEVIEKVIAELEKREDKADDLGGLYEVNYQKELAQFHDGKAHAFMEAIELLKEALRNG
ncbi:hypothetical protein [Priestia megaterium]|uniref:hypothetical protein n=1 Tax=Priestia megaterium TaxID=1404 RepID=UPI003457C827